MKTTQSCREVLAWERFRSRDAAQNKLFTQQRPRVRSPGSARMQPQGPSKVSVTQPAPGEAAQAPPCARVGGCGAHWPEFLRSFLSQVMMLIRGFEDHV